MDAARAARDAAVEAAEEKYPGRLGYGEDALRQALAFNAEADSAQAACDEARQAAWDALKASGDPLVKWIAENCDGHQEQARHVLTALPATVGELDDLADEKDWCTVWDDFRQRAIEAGVIPGVTPPSRARTAVFDRINEESCCHLGPRARRRVDKALDALIQEALTAQPGTTAPQST
ncbi:hypothetical protein ACIHIX_46975 [Streptomyces sp. NPDC051913]|uniref:hypothetical protein n=1 Tax=Streptomyces sp. NPDC051913 TaxID=3365676 RepID=UPI0037D0EB0C